VRELAAEVLERPGRYAQYDRSLVAVVIVMARQRPGLAKRAAQVVRALIEQTDGQIIECEPTPSGNWRAAS